MVELHYHPGTPLLSPYPAPAEPCGTPGPGPTLGPRSLFLRRIVLKIIGRFVQVGIDTLCSFYML